jgi:hypothetical protein
MNPLPTDEQLLQRYPILDFFQVKHLPERLQEVSLPFAHLARIVARNLPYCAETSTALRKLLEAKDCAVRAALGSGNSDE